MFKLPPASSYKLRRAPLSKAIAQVRFPLVAHLQTLEGIAPVQDRLSSEFPFMEEQHMQEMTVSFGAGGQSPAPKVGAARNWLLSDDAGARLTIAAGGATLEVGPEYENVARFAEQFRTVLDALAVAEGLRRCDRLGIRYVNTAEFLEDGGEEGSWRHWFRPELLGWVGTDVVGERSELLSSINQTNLSVPASGEFAGLPGAAQGLIRSGIVPAGSTIPDVNVTVQNPALLLDMDVFVQAPQPFDPSKLVDQFLLFHSQIDRFFRWTITESGMERFELEEAN